MFNENFKILGTKTLTKRLNDITFTDYFYRLSLLAKSVFKWNNLPNGIDEKWIESYLFREGKCMFFKDENLGFMVTKCVTQGTLNNYDEPTKLRGYGTNYNMTKPLVNNEECILIRNNDDMIPTVPTIQLFAMRLSEITRAIDVNVNAQKTPLFIKCSDKQKITFRNMYSQFSGNEPAIFGDKDLNPGTSIEVLKTDAPIVFDKLQIQKHEVWNECMTFLGINNANQNKRERLVDDEVQANNMQIELSAKVMLKSRQEACKRINELFGTNISVEIRKPEEYSQSRLGAYQEEPDNGGVNLDD